MTESAAIEGQVIPPSKIMDSGHMAAYQSMILLADSDALRQEDLKNWQTMIGREQHLWGDRALDKDTLGQYRVWNIVLSDGSAPLAVIGLQPVKPVGKAIGAQWTKVQDEMDDLWPHVTVRDADPLTRAAVVHHTFERIHPFGDGNGRSGRLLALYILRRAGLPPVLFTNWDKATTYYPCFPEKSPEKMIEYFASHQEEGWE